MIYHKDVKIPRRIRGMVPTGKKALIYSRHAQKAFADKYGKIIPPASLTFGEATLVEVSEFGGYLDKLVFRTQYDQETDLVLVLLPCDTKEKWFVKTCWLNLHIDNHSTLDISRFPEKYKY